jgi:hypothetical protein
MQPAVEQETQKAADQGAADEEEWKLHRERELSRDSAGILLRRRRW